MDKWRERTVVTYAVAGLNNILCPPSTVNSHFKEYLSLNTSIRSIFTVFSTSVTMVTSNLLEYRLLLLLIMRSI